MMYCSWHSILSAKKNLIDNVPSVNFFFSVQIFRRHIIHGCKHDNFTNASNLTTADAFSSAYIRQFCKVYRFVGVGRSVEGVGGGANESTTQFSHHSNVKIKFSLLTRVAVNFVFGEGGS